jgi:hypothetical protein
MKLSLVMLACIDPNRQQVFLLVRRKWIGIKFLLLMLVALLVVVLLHWEEGQVLLFHLLQLFQSCPPTLTVTASSSTTRSSTFLIGGMSISELTLFFLYLLEMC